MFNLILYYLIIIYYTLYQNNINISILCSFIFFLIKNIKFCNIVYWLIYFTIKYVSKNKIKYLNLISFTFLNNYIIVFKYNLDLIF